MLNARLMMPCLASDSYFSFINNFFITGFAYWGWGGCNANLCEEITGFICKNKQIGRARLKSAKTNDYQIGAGYLFDWNCWNFAISAGYAYDKQKIESKCGEISFPVGAPFRPACIYGIG